VWLLRLAGPSLILQQESGDTDYLIANTPLIIYARSKWI